MASADARIAVPEAAKMDRVKPLACSLPLSAEAIAAGNTPGSGRTGAPLTMTFIN